MSFDNIHDFLSPFTEGLTGYLAFTKATRTDDANNARWDSIDNFFVEVRNGQYELPDEVFLDNPEAEFYFCPALFDTEFRREAHFVSSNAVWVDFDEPVNWSELEPQPSVVVQTSHNGKVHAYWLLEEPITAVADIRYFNKKLLTGYGEGADPSGYDAGQLLKLPYGRNLKLANKLDDGQYFAPKILKLDIEDRHTEESFAHLPEPSAPEQVIDLSGIADVPEVEDDWEEYAAELVDDKALRRRLRRKGEDRSAELYSLELSLLESLSPDDVFRVLYRSPHDKFTEDFGPSAGATRLWQDINRVNQKRKAGKPDHSDIRARVREITGSKKSADEKSDEVKEIVSATLKDNGKFIQTDTDDLFYLDRRTDRPSLVPVETSTMSNMAGMVNEWFGVNPGSQRTIMTDVLHDALYEAKRQPKISMNYFAHYDYEANKVYVNRNDGSIYVLDGETVKVEPQGYNDVVFYDSDGAYPKPFEYNPNYTPGGLDSLILTGPNYTIIEPGINPKHLKHILLTWLSTFFFPSMMDTRPIVLFFGEADSGKSSFFQNVSLVFNGNALHSVVPMPTDTKDFNVQVCKNSYIFYDNVEVNEKKMQEKLAQAATGYSVKDRKLHTNNEVSSMTARAFIGLTSRTVDRIQKDVAQRYIVVPVHPYLIDETHRRKSAGEIQREVLANRDDLFSELLDYVNKIVKELGVNGIESSTSETISMRMADFAKFLHLTAGLSGLSGPTLESYILKKQADVMSENDALFPAFDAYLGINPNGAKRMTLKDLYEELSHCYRKLTRQYPTKTKFGHGLQAAIQGGKLKYKGIDITTTKSGNGVRYNISKIEGFEDLD